MQTKDRPVGIFDSGVGGLTVVKEIIKLLSHEDIIYFGDTARVPYGTRSTQTIRRFSEESIEFLLKKKVKCVVIACHTVSAVSGRYLKRKYSDICLFDVVTPVLKKLAKSKEKIGVIGTRAAIGSGIYSNLNKVTQVACPLFVPFIEEGEVDGELIYKLTKRYLGKLKVDTLVFGCTHYPIIEKTIKKVLPNTNLINPGVLVSEDLKSFLKESNLLNNQKKKSTRKYYVSDLNERFTNVAKLFLDDNLKLNLTKVKADK
ncbi:glutamate racemase [Patescibacteria group bacterium]